MHVRNPIIHRIAAISAGIAALVCVTSALPRGLTVGSRGAGAAWAASLGVGDRAPAIAVREFVKGEPVKELPKGKVSVVEFWATWCGPCKESIPHLTELAKQYPQVTFVGVSVWESDQARVEPFVREMGAQMDYHIAIDRAIPGTKGEGAMAKSWMEAAGQNGIPTAFIVGKDGKIAWIGHPMTMEEPLEKIAGPGRRIGQLLPSVPPLTPAPPAVLRPSAAHTVALAHPMPVEFTPQPVSTESGLAAAAFRREQYLRPEGHSLLGNEIRDAEDEGDFGRIVVLIDERIARDPGAEETLGIFKFTALEADQDVDGALKYGNRLVSGVLRNNAAALNQLAWPMVNPDAPLRPYPSFQALALDAAKRADALAGRKSASVADTLAAAQFANGDASGAVASEKRALMLLGASKSTQIEPMREHLELYTRAAKADR